MRSGYYRSNNFQDLRKLLGYLQEVLFFNAFKLGTRSKNQVFSNEEALTSNLAFKGGEKSKLSLLIGNCSIPLLNGNLYLMVPSFISMMEPIVLRKGLPKVIGQEALYSTYRT